MLKRKEIVDLVAAKGHTKKDTKKFLSDLIDVITQALVDGEVVNFYGYGTFLVKECSPREIIHNKTQKRITIPAHKSPKFVAGETLKRAIKEGFVRK